MLILESLEMEIAYRFGVTDGEYADFLSYTTMTESEFRAFEDMQAELNPALPGESYE